MASRRRRGPGPLLWALAGVAAVVVAVAVGIALLGGGGDSRPGYPYEVQTFEDLGREHLPVGQRYDFYASDPPTSGPHSSSPAEWGMHDEPVAKEMMVHNMEHGGVVIAYDCSAGTPLDAAQCGALRDQVAAIVAANRGKLLLAAPYAGLEERIALVAWQTLDTLDGFDEARIQAFIDHYERLYNPEGF